MKDKLKDALEIARLVAGRRVHVVSDEGVQLVAEALVVLHAQREVLDATRELATKAAVELEREECAQIAAKVGGVAGRSVAAWRNSAQLGAALSSSAPLAAARCRSPAGRCAPSGGRSQAPPQPSPAGA